MPGNLFNLKRYFNKNDQAQKPQVSVPGASVPPTANTRPPAPAAPVPPDVEPAPPPVAPPPTPPPQTQPPPPPQAGNPNPPPAASAPPPPPPQTQPPPPPPEGTPPAAPAEEVEKKAEEASGELQRRARMDVLTRLTQRSNQTLLKAAGKAKQVRSRFIDTEHILWGLLTDSGIYQLLSKLEITPKELQDKLEQGFGQGDFAGQPQFSPRVKKSLELALSAARSLGYEFISPEHILLALTQEGEGVAAKLLAELGVTVDRLNQEIGVKTEEQEAGEKAKAKASPLEQYARDLTRLAAEGKLDPVVGRSVEIERVIHILSRRTKNNPVLIGDAGVGKTAIVEGLAQKIASGDAPEPLLNKRILSLDLMSLVAGAKHRGEFEERLKGLLREIKSAGGAIILFIDEIHNLVGAGGGSGTMDAANILKPALARGELQAVGTTTIAEYRKYMEKDPALERRFQPVMVNEPTPDQAIEMLRALRDKYEAFHKVSISDEAIEAAVRLSHRYIGDRFLPDKAVDLIDEAASAVRIPAISLPEEIKTLQDKQARLTDERKEAENLHDTVRVAAIDRELQETANKLDDLTAKYEKKKSTTTNTVTPQSIEEIVSEWTRIPVARLTERESDKLIKLEDLIHEQIIDQEAAVQVVAEAVRRGRAGLKSTKRPIGSFIFMGPTGVGKTQLAKVLAGILFGSEEMMVRLDMTEYMEKHEVAKLIGAPPGYVGYEEGGQLTEAVRRKPYSVVLLDEIEKAHPDVFNILIQLLDDGRLTDSKGRTISFKNTIVICTSNIGTGLIQRGMLETTLLSKETAVFDTYAISPVGMLMITLKDRYWILPAASTKGAHDDDEGKKVKDKNKDKEKKGQEKNDEGKQKESPSTSWQTGLLKEFFAGHKVSNAQPGDLSQELPEGGFDTHVILPSGEEWITAGGRYWMRTSQIAKEWTTGSLIELFAGHEVANAAVDDPSEQLPTARLSTNAVTQQEAQIITFGNRYWMRKTPHDTSWETGLLSDYVKTDQIPTDKWDNHLFLPDGSELIIVSNQYWKREKGKESAWQNGDLASLFADQTVANADPDDPSQQLPLGGGPAKQEQKGALESEEKFAEVANQLVEELKKFFRPELLNRFDEILVFRPLTQEHMLAIVDLQIKKLARLLEEQNIGLKVTGKAREQISLIGYDPLYGARPLRRTIQREFENPISSQIIRGELTPGDILTIDFDGNDFTFQAQKPTAEAEAKAETPKEEEKEKEEKEETAAPPEEAAEGAAGAASEKTASEQAAPAAEVQCQDCHQRFPGLPGTVCPYCGSTNTPPATPERTPTTGKNAEPEGTAEIQNDVTRLAEQVKPESPPEEQTQTPAQPTPQTPPRHFPPLAQFYDSSPAPDQRPALPGQTPAPDAGNPALPQTESHPNQ